MRIDQLEMIGMMMSKPMNRINSDQPMEKVAMMGIKPMTIPRKMLLLHEF